MGYVVCNGVGWWDKGGFSGVYLAHTNYPCKAFSSKNDIIPLSSEKYNTSKLPFQALQLGYALGGDRKKCI